MKTKEELRDSLGYEIEEVAGKLTRLNGFYYSKEGLDLDDNDRKILDRQRQFMDQYLEMLRVRLYNVEADIKAAEDMKKKGIKPRK